jgi:protein required for attachment to host cells
MRQASCGERCALRTRDANRNDDNVAILIWVNSSIDQRQYMSRPTLLSRFCCRRERANRLQYPEWTMKLPHDALVVVGDGCKALLLRNVGDEKYLDLRAERIFGEKDPPTPEQEARRQSQHQVSSERTESHRLEEERFADRVAKALEDMVRRQDVPAIVIAAPPKTLADLRRAFHADVKARIVAEVHKDLTNHPIGEIATHIRG